jgi:signal transduction histidine kinase
VAIALVVAAVATVGLQRRGMVEAIDGALTARVDDLSALIVDGALPQQMSVQDDDGALVQIVDSDRNVIAASANIEGEQPIAEVRPATGTVLATTTVLPVGEGEFRLVAGSVFDGDRTLTVYAASTLEAVAETVATLTAILALGVPILVSVVGVTVWVIVGRTLQPVEAIRAMVASIDERQLGMRVPVPPTEDEVGRLAETMNLMLERLQAASEQQRRFVADASHELRSPLAAIRSQLEVDQVHPDLADWRATGQEVLSEALRMQTLVDDLLFLARSDAEGLPRWDDPVDLDDIVFAEVDRAMRDGVTIDTRRVSGARVQGDAPALARAVRNLIENATRYASSCVTLTLAASDGLAVLTVADDGPGIPPEDRHRVLDRFTRLDEARDRDRGGAGLGLAIVRQTAEQHGGSVAVDESTSGGTLVILSVPMREG